MSDTEKSTAEANQREAGQWCPKCDHGDSRPHRRNDRGHGHRAAQSSGSLDGCGAGGGRDRGAGKPTGGDRGNRAQPARPCGPLVIVSGSLAEDSHRSPLSMARSVEGARDLMSGDDHTAATLGPWKHCGSANDAFDAWSDRDQRDGAKPSGRRAWLALTCRICQRYLRCLDYKRSRLCGCSGTYDDVKSRSRRLQGPESPSRGLTDRAGSLQAF